MKEKDSMENFRVTSAEVRNVSVLHLNGYLDAHTAPDFERAIQGLVEQKKVRIVVNLSKLQYISSAGLGVFMGFITDIRAQGGDIKLAELTDKVYRVFELLGFPVLYEIFRNEQEAVDKFPES
jgi:anti-sigma B factor antagonist